MLESDKWRLYDLKNIKRQFWEKGFYLYEDIEYLVYCLFYENEDITKMIARRFPVILIDECQDLSYTQLEIIKLINKNP